MYCISINHNYTPLEVRQQLTFTKQEQKQLLLRLTEQQLVEGGVLLSTCGRMELYFTVKEKADREAVEAELAEKKAFDVGSFRKYTFFYEGKKALIHLGRVVCGMDSALIGEDEIFHQTKEAYEYAKAWKVTSEEINISFQAAFHIARESKRCTRLKETPVSVGTLTANYVERFLSENQEEPQAVLVIGATGKIGSIVVSDLLDKGITVFGTIRTHGRNEHAMTERKNLIWIPFEVRYRYLQNVSAIVSATASPHYTLLEAEYARHLSGRRTLLIDLAVPYDIDRQIGEFPGHTILNVDDIHGMAKKNYEIKQQEISRVEEIIEAGVEEIQKKLYIHEFMQKLSDREEPWFLPMIYYLKGALNSDLLLDVLLQIEKKELM